MHVPILPLTLLATLACPTLTGDDEADPSATSEPGPRAPEAAAPRERRQAGEDAIAAIRARDYEQARAILAGMLVAERLAEARELLAAGRARDALLPLDDALELEPRNAEAWYLRGQAAFETAPTDSQPGFFYADALGNFEEALRRGHGVEAVFAASRAARMTPDPTQALDYARRGLEFIENVEPRPALDVLPERVAAEASFDVYRELRAAEEDASEPFALTEDYLGRVLGRTPEDPWAWAQLANLYQWEGRTEEAVQTIERGLDLAPDDAGLHSRLAELARELHGRAGVIAAYERFNERHGDVALGAWYLARETFDQALADLSAGQDSRAGFQRAAESFRRSRELEPDYEASCKAYEVMCPNAVGWCRFNQGELQGAKDAFLAMRDVVEDGLAWKIEGSLLSGVMGLQFVASRYSDEQDDAAAQGNAAAIYDYLHVYDPDDPDFANNAGFFNRDTAVLLEYQARGTRSRAREEADPVTRSELEQEAERLQGRAWELMLKSYDAYVDASRLAPDDVRVVNDTGLIMAYYLGTDVEAAERYLLRAVEAGARQVPAMQAAVADFEAEVAAVTEENVLRGPFAERFQELADSEGASELETMGPFAALVDELAGELEARVAALDSLREAYGDAHQNLGVLNIHLKNQPARAREWLARCFEIDPRDSRAGLEPLIAACERLLAGEPGAREALDRMLDRMVWTRDRR